MNDSKTTKILRRAMAILLTVVMLFTQLPLGVFAVDSQGTASSGESAEPIYTIEVGSTVTVTEKTTFAFRPESSGVYAVRSGNSGESDPYVSLRDSNMEQIAIDDDGGEGLDFDLNYSFVAGEVYYIIADNYRENFSYTLSLQESDILSIEYVSGGEYEYIENDFENGEWNSVYNEEIVDRYFWYYAYPTMEDIVIKVNYKDGTSENLSYLDENEEPTGIRWDWDFYKNPWTVGSENGLDIIYKGLKTTVNVTVLESPVSSMEVISIGNSEFEEFDGAKGYWSKDYCGISVEEHFEYFTYEMLEETVLSVTYKDGTVEEVPYKVSEDKWNPIAMYSDQYLNPWTVGGDNEVEIWYKGAVVTAPVTVTESPVESISLASGGKYEYVEFDTNDGYWYNTYDSEYFYYYTNRILEDVVLNVNYKDGTTKQINAWNNEAVIHDDDQNNNHWTVGSENYLTIRYSGAKLVLPVTVTPCPIASVEAEDVTVSEYTDGEWDRWYEDIHGETVLHEYFHYNIYPDEITIHYTDGSVVSGTPYEIWEQTGYDVDCDSDQGYDNQWGVGEHTATISFMGVTAEYTVTVTESPVESVFAEPVTLIEGTRGEWNSHEYEQDGEWFEEKYFYYHVESPKITVTYKDGSVISGTPDEIYEQTGYYPQFRSDQGYYNQWGVGEYTATVSFMGATAQYTVTITESPVESIAIEPVTFTEGTNGWWNYYEYEQDGEWLEGEYFYYDVSPQNITVTYKDGRVVSGNADEIWDQTGESLQYYLDQSYDNPWGVGEHIVTAVFMGITVEFTVTITESPIESIVVEPITYVEGTNGHSEHWFDEQVLKECYYYNVSPEKITVTYRDGRVISGNADEIWEQTGYYPEYNSDQSYENQWGAGEHTATVSFMGATAQYTITITETPVESVVVEPITRTQYTEGWWQEYHDYEGNMSGEYYRYSIEPQKITVTYKDGRVVSGTIDEIGEQTGYYPAAYSDQDYFNQWGIGTYTAKLRFMGIVAEYDINITESSIESIVVDPVTYIEGTNGYWQDHFEDAEIFIGRYYEYSIYPNRVTVTYKDGRVVSGTPDEIWDQTGYYPEYHSEQSYYNQWGVGEHTATVSFMGATAEFTVTITESPIESIVVDPIKHIKGTNGYWSYYEYEQDGEWLEVEYYHYNYTPENITVTYKDGRVVSGTPDEIWEQTGYEVAYDSNQSYDNQWGVGDNIANISFMGFNTEYFVTIVESPIESIVVDPIIYIEGTNCDRNRDYYDENGGYLGDIYFIYHIDPENITITYDDGTVISGTADEIWEQTGEYISYNSDQSYANQWGVGEHTVNISFMGFDTQYTITVEESPFESIVVEPMTIIEGTNGYWSSYGYEQDGEWLEGKYFAYNYKPQNVTVTYKDGTVISGTLEEIMEQTGYEVYYEANQSYENQWGVGDNTASVSFVNLDVEYTVTIIPCEIESITVEPVISVIGEDEETYGGYYDEQRDEWVEEEWVKYSCYPQMITVTFKDGSKLLCDYDQFYELGYQFEIIDGQSYFERWETGSHTVTLKGIGFETTYTVDLVEKKTSGDYTYAVLADGTAAILRCDIYGEELVIPETIDGYVVTVIGSNAFNYKNYVSVTIPDTVVRIEEYAFCGCYAMQKIKMSSGVKAIANWAFADCKALETVVYYGTAQDFENIAIFDNNDSITDIQWLFATACTEHIYDNDCDKECNVCFEIREVEHKFEWITDYEGNCVENGWKHEKCELCGEERNHDTVIESPGYHQNTERIGVIEATCGKAGHTGNLYCYDCETVVEYGENIEPTGEHINTYIVGEEEATCGKDGFTGTLYCQDCDQIVKDGEVIPATGNHHNTELINAKVATCGEQGYTGDIYCNDCKTVIKYGDFITATGKHVYDNNYDEDCNVCGETRTVSETQPQLSANSGVTHQGETIRVDVRIDGNTGFAGLQMGVIYDKANLTLVGVENHLSDFNMTNGNSIVWDAVSNYTEDGIIATLIFEVAEDAALGDYDIHLRFMSASNEDFEAVKMTTVGAVITVESAVLGDANGDGKVDTIDLVMLRRYLASMDPLTGESDIAVKKGADANGDGVIDTIDLAYVRNYLADMEVTA